MKHISVAEKSLLVGDEAADTLIEYAALLGKLNSADSVQLNAVGIDGEEVTASFLLNSGSVFVVQSTNSTLPEPDNDAVVAYMREKLDGYRTPDLEALSEGFAAGTD
ncbi:hypothetical protein [Desertivibrio insolitus]|uniref:hypothetical protein n=1 Tax=Herbiconiux sp. SYSU D00978 TaxID=2812562 RepID=UPI001A960B94|nr:hypothetical protein [Herbiconiux sp. SYSU D00978]